MVAYDESTADKGRRLVKDKRGQGRRKIRSKAEILTDAVSRTLRPERPARPAKAGGVHGRLGGDRGGQGALKGDAKGLFTQGPGSRPKAGGKKQAPRGLRRV